VPVWGILLATLTSRFLKYSWTRAFLLFSGLVGLHLYLDLPNSYGTQILSPFSAQRFAYDSVFIIDFFWLALFAFTFFVGRRWGPTVSKKLFVVALIYPLFNLGVRLGLEHHLQGRNPDLGTEIKVSSDAFSPFRWKVFEVSQDKLELRPWSILSGLGESAGSFTRTSPDFFSNRYNQHLLFRVYDWFAVYPVIAKEQQDLGTKRYTVQDLRFYSTLDFVRRRMLNAPFEFEFTESNGKVTEWRFFSGGPTPQTWTAKAATESDGPIDAHQ
jgi:hypothetical protein